MTPRDIAIETAQMICPRDCEPEYRSDIEGHIESAIEKDRALRGQWVSVEERLPEKDVRVAICLKHSVSVGYLSYGSWADETEWVGDEGWHTPADVTHWQPLPPPPAKEQT